MASCRVSLGRVSLYSADDRCGLAGIARCLGSFRKDTPSGEPSGDDSACLTTGSWHVPLLLLSRSMDGALDFGDLDRPFVLFSSGGFLRTRVSWIGDQVSFRTGSVHHGSGPFLQG